MATSTIRKFFENLKGLNESFTKLTRPAEYMDDAQNVVWLPNGNLEKRKGGKFISQVAGSPKTNVGKFRMPIAIMPYSHIEESRLANSQDLCVISVDTSSNNHGFMFELLASGTISITYTGAPATVILTFKPNSSNVWELNITENGVAVSGFPKQYGTGLEDSPTALTTLVSDIDGLANYTCSATYTTSVPAAVLPLITSLDLSSGSGTISYNYLDTYHCYGSSTTYFNPYGLSKFRSAGYTWPSFVSLRDCLYFTGFDTQLHKFDGSRVRRAGVPIPEAVMITSLGGAGSAPSLNGTYVYYYTHVKTPYKNRGGEIESLLSEGVSVATATQTVQLQLPSARFPKVLAITGANAATTTLSCTKIDAEFPLPTDVILLNNTSGNYELRTISKRDIDAGTITIDSNAATNANNWVLQATELYGNDFFEDSCVVTANGTGVTTISCSNTNASRPLIFRAGDIVSFPTLVLGTVQTREVLSSTTTTITIAGSGVNVVSGAVITAASRVRFYRTKVGGFEKFLLSEINDPLEYGSPLDPVRTLLNPPDKTPDTQLTIQYLPPSRTPDPPPICKFVVVHQDLLVVAGDFTNPGTVSFSEPDNVEAFPLASNSFSPSFSGPGNITGLASDNGVLIVFSESERAIVSGSLAAGDFRVDVVPDGVGCVSHSSISNTESGVIWLSKRGFERSFGGQLDNEFYLTLWNRFRNQFYKQTDGVAITTAQESQFVMQRARSTYDPINNLYICFVPCETGTPDTGTTIAALSTTKYANSNSKWFVYDTEQDAWAVFSLPEKMNAAGGIAMFQNELYWASAYKADSSTPPDVAGHVLKRHSTGTIYDYADGADAVSCSVSTSWESLGEPNLIKKLLTLKIWQMMSDAILPFTVNVDVYYDWSDSNTHTSTTKTFSSASTVEHDVKAKAGKKLRSFKIKLSNSTLHEGMSITGIQSEISLPYRVEVKS